ncbi:hypothetical protein, variant [Sphaeroforma arctica JP610]|nr:hypothetical protein, variant [Sphaeroforma arctica JP610]KNC74383.1 hypothetical protein, variant [Sphaeroforma arctica JP610]|eukprot:XP_014148285.1 hypothetical protein, variant [Sphaeroforma arctica JP610]
MYQKRGCVTIATTAPAGSVMFPGTSAVRELASSVLNEAASSINRVETMADNTKVPLIVHAFSNGGAFVVETIENLIQENSQDVERTVSNPGTVIEKDTKLQENTQLAADRIRLGGQVFDSAPAMMHLQAGVTAIGHAIPGSAILRVGVQAVFGIVAALGVVYARATGAPGRGVVFWDHMQQSNLGCKQYYIYSVDDELTDAKYLDELIAYRKEKGVEITAIRLESSPHVQHLKSHPEVYNQFVDNILEEAGMHASSN